MFTYDPASQGIQETLGADLTNSRGTAVTPNASANTYGSWFSLGTTTRAYEAFSVLAASAAGSTSTTYSCDIGIYDGTTYIPILTNYLVHVLGSTTPNQIDVLLPIHVPAGAQVGARVQCAGAAGADIHLAVCGVATGHAGQPGYARGFNLLSATSLTAANCVSGSANTKARTVVAASTLERAEAIMCLVRTNNSGRSFVYDIEIGSAANEAPVFKSLLFGAGGATGILGATPVSKWPVPAASRLACNVQCTTGSTSLHVMPYGFA